MVGMVMVVGLVVLQNLSQLQSGVLADAVQLAESLDCRVTFAGNGLKRLAFLHLMEVGLRSE
jgi:hypothetical protein